MSRRHNVANTIDGEKIIALVILSICVYMFIESYSFSYDAALWPRYISIAAMIGSSLIIVQNYLPNKAQTIVQEDHQTIGTSGTDTNQREESNENSQEIFNVRDAIFTTVLIIIFGIIVLVLGYVAATLIFVITYSYHFKINMFSSIIILLVCLIPIYFIGQALNIPIFEGLIDIIPRVKI